MSNKAFEAARRKGLVAALNGQPESDNPYGDERTNRGSVTFARAFWRAWREGWRLVPQPVVTFKPVFTGTVMYKGVAIEELIKAARLLLKQVDETVQNDMDMVCSHELTEAADLLRGHLPCET